VSASPQVSGPRPPRAPSDLRARGRAFWRDVVGTFGLERDELEILAEACRAMDHLDEMREIIASDGVTVPGSRGQLAPHPLLVEQRGTRVTLARLLSQLALPDEDGNSIPTPLQARGRQAAAKRWAGHTRVAELDDVRRRRG
jgi:P27 family predicted phage terminase small subunit